MKLGRWHDDVRRSLAVVWLSVDPGSRLSHGAGGRRSAGSTATKIAIRGVLSFGLERLRIKHRGAGRGLPAVGVSHPHAEFVVNRLPRAVEPSMVFVTAHRGPRIESRRQQRIDQRKPAVRQIRGASARPSAARVGPMGLPNTERTSSFYGRVHDHRLRPDFPAAW